MNLINFDFEISLPIDRWEYLYEKTWKTPFKNKYFQVSAYKTNTLLPGTPKTNPGTYPDIYCGVKADD